MAALLIILAGLSQGFRGSQSPIPDGARVTGHMSVPMAKPDRFGFLPWSYRDTDERGLPRTISVRARLVAEKNGLLTLKTERGQTLKIEKSQIPMTSKPLLNWLDAELAKRDAKANKSKPHK